MSPLRLTLLIPAAALLAGCGSFAAASTVAGNAVATGATPQPVLSTPAPAPSSPAASAAPTETPVPPGVVRITQLGIDMRARGLSWVRYRIENGSTGWGMPSDPDEVIVFRTPQFDAAVTGSGASRDGWYTQAGEIAVGVYSGPVPQPSGYPGADAGLATQAGSRWLYHIVPDGGACSDAVGTVLDTQLPLLRAMIESATPTA